MAQTRKPLTLGMEMPYMTVDKEATYTGKMLIRQRTRKPLTLGRRCLI